MKKRICAMVLALSFLLCGCAGLGQRQAPQETVSGLEPDGAFRAASWDFGLELLLACGEGQVISPLSVQMALAMAGAGAEGQTRQEMEAVLGLSVEDLNRFHHSLLENLPRELGLASGVWFHEAEDRIQINEDYLETCLAYYGAQAATGPFDETTRQEINNWVSQATHGRIAELLNALDSASVVCLVNALSLEGTWLAGYQDQDLIPGTFTQADGREQDVTMMCSTESYYIESQGFTGFVKGLQEGNLKFAALLPPEGTDLMTALEDLGSHTLAELVLEPQAGEVTVQLPRLTLETSLDLREPLTQLGMGGIFSPAADFSGMGQSPGGLSVGQVQHAARVDVGLDGIEADAATAAICTYAIGVPEAARAVTLDRPFLLCVLDGDSGTPLFLAAVTAL